MDNIGFGGGWVTLAIVAYIAFMIGRLTAGMGGASSPAQRLADEQEIAAASATVSSSTWAEVDRLLAEKKKIEAIKALRDASGLGLKLAKDAVERRAPGR